MAKHFHPRTETNPFGAGRMPMPPDKGFKVSMTLRMSQAQAIFIRNEVETGKHKLGEDKAEIARALMDLGMKVVAGKLKIKK